MGMSLLYSIAPERAVRILPHGTATGSVRRHCGNLRGRRTVALRAPVVRTVCRLHQPASGTDRWRHRLQPAQHRRDTAHRPLLVDARAAGAGSFPDAGISFAASGVQPVPKSNSSHMFPWAFERYHAGQALVFTDPDELPPEAQLEREGSAPPDSARMSGSRSWWGAGCSVCSASAACARRGGGPRRWSHGCGCSPTSMATPLHASSRKRSWIAPWISNAWPPGCWRRSWWPGPSATRV